MDSAAGDISAAPSPWTSRAPTSVPEFWASPPASEATPNSAVPVTSDQPPPEQVGEPPAEQQEASVGDYVAAEHPLQVLDGEVQVTGDGRERDVDDRGVEEVEERDRAEEGQDQLAPAGGEEGRASVSRWSRHVGCAFLVMM